MWKRHRRQLAPTTWDQQAEVARLEREWCWTDPEEAVDVPDGLLARFGRDRPESRKMTPALWKAADQAQDGNWSAALPVFREVMTAHRDYDVPYFWLANFLNDSGRTRSAITLLTHAVPRCGRKSTLLRQAAEFTLSTGDVRGAFHLLAQSIAGMPGLPGHDDVGRQRAFLFIAEMFEGFGDTAGSEWARRASFIIFEKSVAGNVRDSAAKVGEPVRSVLLAEAPVISTRLRGLFPA